jgi:uncharacterized protein YwgA
MRSIDEQVKDMLLELFLLENASCYREMDSRMKVQKLHFISQSEMTKNLIKGTNLRFFTLWRGPYSKLLANDLRALQELGLITSSHRLTDRGKGLLDLCRKVFEREPNTKIVGEILAVLEEYGPLSAEELEQITHDMQVIPVGLSESKPIRIRDLQPKVDVLAALETTQSKIAFELTEDELASLELSFCWAEEDLAAMRRSSTMSYEELFEGV